jgi:hypothetical protein
VFDEPGLAIACCFGSDPGSGKKNLADRGDHPRVGELDGTHCQM